jgi:hypothetical protein
VSAAATSTRGVGAAPADVDGGASSFAVPKSVSLTWP